MYKGFETVISKLSYLNTPPPQKNVASLFGYLYLFFPLESSFSGILVSSRRTDCWDSTYNRLEQLRADPIIV